MAGTSPTVGNSFVRQFPTPSPYSFPATPARWGSTLQLELSGLLLRFSALVLCFVSSVTLATHQAKRAGSPSSFAGSPELVYTLIASIVAFVYSALQLFKGVCNVSHEAVLIPDKISDYLSFILDQVLAYLLISSSSLGLRAIQRTDNASSLRRAAIVSITMSFAAFSVMAACALLSGYKLCKRIIW